MLEINELEELLDKISEKVMIANRMGELEDLLKNWGLSDILAPQQSVYETDKNGKVVVIGQTEVKERDLLGIVNSLGLDKSRFEFCLEYEKAKTYQYSKLRYNPKYRVVLMCQVPHSSVGKNDSSSVITEMENKEGYPRTERLISNNELKLTKSNFKQKLEQLIEENYI